MRTTIGLPDELHEVACYLANSRGDSISATIAALIETVILAEPSRTSAARAVRRNPRLGLLTVTGGPTRRAAEVRSLAYGEEPPNPGS